MLFLAPLVSLLLSKRKEGGWNWKTALWHLPILQQVYLYKRCKEWCKVSREHDILKGKIDGDNKNFQKILSPQRRRRLRRSHLKEVQSNESQLESLFERKEAIESDLQQFKSYEGFCEAAPQFILQGSLWLVVPSVSEFEKFMRMSSLAFSFTSLVFSASGVYIKMPFLIGTDQKVPKVLVLQFKVVCKSV